jgi:sugar phosphate isomerase/epimerase
MDNTMKQKAELDTIGTPGGVSRRSFLGIAGAAPVVWAVGRVFPALAASRIPVALQLYSVRNDCKANFDAALEQVAAMGFEGVEFAGYYGYTSNPAGLAAKLKSLNLKAAGTHVRMDALRGDALKATIEFHQAIGCRFLVVPGDQAFTDPEKSKVLADEMNAVAAALKPLGMATGYHNHVNEFKTDGGKTFWDLFAERTTKDVILQQDCGWTMAAGQDPAAYIRKYPGRTRTTHFKPTVREGDTGKKAIFGQDSVDWKSVYEACQSVGGTEWVVIEQEVYPDGKSPMDCTRESLAGFKAMFK